MRYLLSIVVVFLLLASSTSMPVGDLDGWRQVFTEDFSQEVSRGQFPGTVYGDKWDCYSGFNSTDKRGRYDKIVSVTGGILNMYVHTNKSNGISYTAAPVPLVSQNGTWGGQIYGKFSVRFRADSLPDYKTAWLLWPDSENWNEGEIDFPEGKLNGTISGFSHCTSGNPRDNCFYVHTDSTYTDWHVATIEWAPDYLSFILDDVVVGKTNRSDAIPTTKLHWVLQTETWFVVPNPDVSGNIQIDWAVIYAYDTPARASSSNGPTTGASSTSGVLPEDSSSPRLIVSTLVLLALVALIL